MFALLFYIVAEIDGRVQIDILHGRAVACCRRGNL